MKFSDRLKGLREKNDMTQEQLAKVSGVFPPVPYRDTNAEPPVLAWMQRRSWQRHLIFLWISFSVRMVCSLLRLRSRTAHEVPNKRNSSQMK